MPTIRMKLAVGFLTWLSDNLGFFLLDVGGVAFGVTIAGELELSTDMEATDEVLTTRREEVGVGASSSSSTMMPWACKNSIANLRVARLGETKTAYQEIGIGIQK